MDFCETLKSKISLLNIEIEGNSVFFSNIGKTLAFFLNTKRKERREKIFETARNKNEFSLVYKKKIQVPH